MKIVQEVKFNEKEKAWTRRKGVEVLRQQIINRLVTEVREEYCAKLYRFMLYRRLSIVEEEEYIKNIRDLGYS